MEEKISRESAPKRGADGKRPVIWIIIGIVLLGVVAYAAWQLATAQNDIAKLRDEKNKLQSQVTLLNKQLATASALDSASTSSATGVCSPERTISDETRDAITAAVVARTPTTLRSYMASLVTVVYAASEKGGTETADEAVASLDYLDATALSPWNFELDESTVTEFKAGFYKQYFEGRTHVGQSSNGVVVSFGFDSCAKIHRIFIAVDADLLR